ncbi:hypothetical protein EDB19DRAFT_205921 [Suillus lakei]|nr:hypothetical protein EDB19DRAFT_205921 [Suillus lakei]
MHDLLPVVRLEMHMVDEYVCQHENWVRSVSGGLCECESRANVHVTALSMPSKTFRIITARNMSRYLVRYRESNDVELMQIVWLRPTLPAYKSQRTSLKKHHQFSAMKFTSLTAMISAAVMASVAVASEDLIVGVPCNKANSIGCSPGIKGFNNGNDFGYLCGPHHTMISFTACSCSHCCKLTADGKNIDCGS